MTRSITVLTRKDCHLCDEAMPKVLRVARLLGVAVRVEDVDEAGLADKYGSRVPVVLGAGDEELASGRITTGELLMSLARRRK
jgi:thiol-disulfide isomerase/thioredoxin